MEKQLREHSHLETSQFTTGLSYEMSERAVMNKLACIHLSFVIFK